MLTNHVHSQWVPHAAELFFAPISGISGRDVRLQVDMCKSRCLEYGFDYLATFYIAPREMHHIITILFDRSKSEEEGRAEALLRIMIQDAAQHGYGEYRTHLAFHDQVARTYNWNDGALMRLNETVHDALDPNGIVRPSFGVHLTATAPHD